MYCYFESVKTKKLSEYLDEQQYHFDKVLERLKRYRLTVNIKKCRVGLTEISLGYLVDEKGIQKQPEKLQCIKSFPIPQKVKDLRRIIGVCNWYSQLSKITQTQSCP